MFNLKLLTIASFCFLLPLFLSSCSFSEIIDLRNQYAKEFQDKYNFNDPKYNRYKINNVLFIPYFIHNDYKSYSLKLSCYALENPKIDLTIESIELFNKKIYKKGKIDISVNTHLEFSEKKLGNSLFSYNNITLVDRILKEDLILDKNSSFIIKIKIDTKNSIKILKYDFNTKIRKYLIQR